MREIRLRGKVPNGLWWHVNPYSRDWNEFWETVDRETVGQYIGLKDKYGKEVYDGDILSGQLYRYGYEIAGWNKAYTGVVQWVQRDQLYGLYLIDKNEEPMELLYATHRNEDFNGDGLLLEIIGNIYDTPLQGAPEE